MELKALSLWQPWASLVAGGAKKWETRSWGTPYRGLLAIHATKKADGEVLAYAKRFTAFLERRCPEGVNREVLMRPLGLTFGRILAVCRLADCRPMEHAPDHYERAFGDFGPGRWGWKLEDVIPLLDPVEATGRQGLWDVAGDALDRVLEQLPAEADPLPCPVCGRPMDAKARCWKCSIRLCACGATISSPFIGVCRMCEVGEARRRGVAI